MKTTRLNVRMWERRLNKLRSYASLKDKTVTQIVEDWVDKLPNTLVATVVETESVKNSADPLPVKESGFELVGGRAVFNRLISHH